MFRRWLALFVWAYGVWLLITWMVTAEQLTFGALLAASVASAMAGLGDVAAPWSLLHPRRLGAALILLVTSLGRIVKANVGLAIRIWSPRRPVRTGMVIVPTGLRTDAGLAGLGLITSLIVDNQIVDLDRSAGRLQYHAVDVPPGGLRDKAAVITAPTEKLLAPITGG